MASFLLIQAKPDRAEILAQSLPKMTGVYDASVTSGPYDVIAEVTVLKHQQHIRHAVRSAPGLMRLRVCQGSARRPVMS